MKKEDLMIGDWVVLVDPDTKERKITQVTTSDIGDDYILSLFEPLEITPEILEKNGFTKGGMFGKTYYLAVEDFEISVYFAHINTQLIIEKRNGKEIINILNVEYLHILQHALKLCGIEKEIII